jgi:hypothetical protein
LADNNIRMIPMKLSQPLVLAFFIVVPVYADDDVGNESRAAALDLSVPGARAIYRNDPPGTWYGDTSGAVDASSQWETLCPVSPTGEPRKVTGSVTTGIGYSSRWGSSTFNAATLNYCREYAGEDGGSGVINVNISVGQHDSHDRMGGYQQRSMQSRPAPGRPRR